MAPVANPTVRGQKHQARENECACLVPGQKKYELILTFSFPYFYLQTATQLLLITIDFVLTRDSAFWAALCYIQC